MEELFTLAYLGTYAGSVLAVTILTQVLKPLLQKIDTHLICLVIALIIQIGVAVITRVSVGEYFLAVINAGAVTLGAMGAYDLTFRSVDARKRSETPTE